MTGQHATLLRKRGEHDSGRVGMVELFFDLVFVFAITQLSHGLLANLSVTGAAQTALLLPATWWVWTYTTWCTNWLDPARIPVRLCLFALMIAGLVLAAAIPRAFAERGLVFALAYASMQIGRTLFMLWALRHAPQNLRRSFQRVLAWLLLGSAVWIAGGLADAEARVGLWLLALGIELAAPLAYYWTPGLGRSHISDWDIDGAHMAERAALFVIIALGESLLITGATFAECVWNLQTSAAMLVALIGTIAMWWIYFDTGHERAAHRIVHASDPGRQGRSAYTYLHIPMVAGVIACAVADELVLVHPDHASAAAVVAIVGGPFLYVLGNLLFKWTTNDRRSPPLSHSIGLGLLALLAPLGFAHGCSALVLSGLTTLVLVIVASWESIALSRR